MSAATGTATAPAALTDRRRAALRGLVNTLVGARGARRVVVFLTGPRSAEAGWLAAYLRAGGVTSEVRAAGRWPVEQVESRAAAAAGEPGTAVLVLADGALRLPPAVVQLAGTDDDSPLDLWRPEDATEAAVRALLAALPPAPRVRTGDGGDLACVTSGAVPGGPAGTVEAPLTAADGTFVADGALAVNRRTAWDARLAGRPVTLTVAEGLVTAVDCRDPALRHFLTRAVEVHGARTARALRLGTRRGGGFSSVDGPVNATRYGVTLRLAVGAGDAYNPASADLRIDLTAASGDWS
ncbi:hypothetical protein [Streptomyces avicenniae]|uniref:hypothetical protein n=1 Tax=Streptomyces avicenniae TaxID=500153 RepID=UPI00069AABFC|nr:hypothetical protein [Streptomyces avicenniae]